MAARIKKRTAEQQAKYEKWLETHNREKAERARDAAHAAADAAPPRPAAADEYALSPDTSKLLARLERAEAALREIEGIATEAIYRSGITQEPKVWVKLGDFVLKYCAPIRDRAREGVKA